MNSNPAIPNPLHRWLTVKLLAKTEPAFTEAAIRNLIFNAAPRHTSRGPIPGNGLAPHIRRVGTKVLINHGGFLSWIDGLENQVESVAHPENPGETSCALPVLAMKGDLTESRGGTSIEPHASTKQKIRPMSCSKQHSRGRT
jgi:hypothetical protein